MPTQSTENFIALVKSFAKDTDTILVESSEPFDMNKIVALMGDLVAAKQAYTKSSAVKSNIFSDLLEGVKLVLVEYQVGNQELDNCLATVKLYLEAYNRKDSVKRRWRRNTNGQLTIIAKRRYWRHKNTYNRAFKNWKRVNEKKAFYDRLRKFSKAAFEGNLRVYKEDVVALMKAISSAYTHFTIGLETDTQLHEHLAAVTEIVTASLNDLSNTISLTEANDNKIDERTVADIYTNTLFLNSMLFTDINLEIIDYEE